MIPKQDGRRRGWRPWAIAGLVALAAGLAAGAPSCATPTPDRPFLERLDPERVWPEPPARGRIGYVGELRSGEDLGQRRGWLTRVVDVVVGRDPMALVKPLSVAQNSAGLLVVADPGRPTVHFFDLARKKYRWLDEDLSAQLAVPVGVALDDAGNAYVADAGRQRVFVFDADRKLIREIGVGVLQRPTGVALDPARGLLHVVDTLAGAIVTFDRLGAEVGRFGSRGSGRGQFNSPTYVAVGPDGRLAVADSLNFRVQLFDPDGRLLGSLGQAGNGAGDLARPKGVAFDAKGRLYVVDGAFDNVQIFDPQGALLLAFGGPGREPGRFNLPVGMSLDASHTIWVADSYNGRVQAFRLLEEVGP